MRSCVLRKVCERYIAEREADRRDGIAAPELDQPVVAATTEERARIRWIRIKDLKDHAGIIIKAARDTCIKDDVAHAALFKRGDERFYILPVNERKRIFFG